MQFVSRYPWKLIRATGKTGWTPNNRFKLSGSGIGALAKDRPADRRPVIISRMTARDIRQVAELERGCFSQPWSENVLSLELQNPRAVFFVARVAGRAVGYVGMHRVLDEGYIANVAVGKDYRRRGIAGALVRRLLRYAKRERLLFTTLEVRESNSAAIALYSGMGFGEAGRRRGFYASPVEDAVLMTRFFA